MNPISRLFGLFSGVLLTFLVAVPCVSAQAQDRVYSMAEAKNHVGEFASVVGESNKSRRPARELNS